MKTKTMIECRNCYGSGLVDQITCQHCGGSGEEVAWLGEAEEMAQLKKGRSGFVVDKDIPIITQHVSEKELGGHVTLHVTYMGILSVSRHFKIEENNDVKFGKPLDQITAEMIEELMKLVKSEIVGIQL